MSETDTAPALDRYRDWVTEQAEAGRPFGHVEDAIDEAADLTEDAKAALWLLAFSLQDQGEQGRAARAYVGAVG